MTNYIPTIGLEIHAELATKSKMFCGCKNSPHDSNPNLHVCPICLAHPGTLPVVNHRAVELLLNVGAAVNGSVAKYSEFDRKNYFYPDIPKAYQISQYEFPFITGGELAGVPITRIHLEEDTARSQHTGKNSVVDFNRAGVPLMELVTEPVIHDARIAGTFARELRVLLRTLGASMANMERGELRVEANISVRKSSDTELGKKVEVKNLNSFRSVEAAISFEIDRQIQILEAGSEVEGETRGWDEEQLKTYTQRRKETAEDYRYFPDPDIPKFDLRTVPDFNISRIRKKLPELPHITKNKLLSYGVNENVVMALLERDALREFYMSISSAVGNNPERMRVAVNYITSDVAGLLESTDAKHLDSSYVSKFLSLIEMLESRTIGSRVAKDLLPEVLFGGVDPVVVATERGLTQVDDDTSLRAIAREIIAECSAAVEEYRNGKQSSLQYLIGQGMKKSRGAANPQKLAQILKEELQE